MGKTLRDEDIRLNFVINGQQASKQLNSLDKEAAKLRGELQGMKKGSDDYIQASKRLKDVEKQQAALRKEVGLTAMSLRDLTKESRKLNAIKQNLTPGTAEFQKVDAELKKVNSRIKELRNGSQATGNALKDMSTRTIAIWTAVAAGVNRAFRAVQGFLEARDEQLRMDAKLSSALGGQEAAYRRLTQLASDLQRTRGLSDEEVRGHMSFLALQGRTEEQIRRTILAASELSAVTGVTLADAIKNLDGTFEGNLGRLSRLDAAFVNLTKEQLANGAAVDLMLEKYGGQAEASFSAGIGPLRAYQLALGDLQKAIGAFLINFFNPIWNTMLRGTERMTNALVNLRKTSKEVFSEQLDVVTNLEEGIRPLLDRYDSLVTKSSRSATEQDELNSIIDQVAKTIPGAITQFDAYGSAIALSTTRARAFIDAEIDRLKIMNRDAIQEAQEQIKRRQELAERSQALLAEIEQKGTYQIVDYIQTGTRHAVRIQRDATQEEVAETVHKHQTLLSEINGYQAELRRLNGDYIREAIQQREEEAGAQKKITPVTNDQRKAVEEQAGAYAELVTQIAAAEKQLKDLVANEDYAGAQQTQASLDSMKAMKAVWDGIIAVGGDVDKFISTLNDEQLAEFENFRILLDDSRFFFDTRAQQGQMHLEARKSQINQETAAEAEATRERIRISQEGWQVINEAMNSAFSLWQSHQSARMENELAALAERRDKELEAENLTAEQRERIQTAYRIKETQIKREAWRKQQRADLLQSVINGALAVSRALPNLALAVTAGALAAIQTATIAAQPVPQFAKGKYPVIGQDDGRLYYPTLGGKPRTGIYSEPTLVAEEGPEIVIDAPTTRHIRANYPEILQSIQSVRQYAGGKGLREPTPINSSLEVMITENTKAINELKETVSRLSHQVDSGINANVYLTQFDRKYKRFNELKDSAKI